MGVTVGVIGLGRIGAFHTDTLSTLDGVDGLVVTDARADLTATVAAKFGTLPVDSAQALLASGVDGVVVAAATPSHASLVLACVDAGIPVFCEKPLAATPGECRAIVQKISMSSVPVQVGYNRRFAPAFVAAKDAVVSGDLGWLHTVRSTTLDPAPPSMEYIAVSGGIFRDCSVHDFDIVRWIVGREVIEVYAAGANQGDARFTVAGDVDTATIILTFDNGTIGVVSNTRYNARGYDCRLEVHGSTDSVVAGWDEQIPVRNLEVGVRFPSGIPHTSFMDRFTTAYRAELTAFVDVIVGRRESPCTASDALEVAFIAEAATLSLQQHRPVRIDEVRL
ncbi:dehydrogenase [Rhodococcus sp. PAMC28707]|uniref:Gfo/Idh/MocA family protein n=1 Tax=unclassified Rhodococcus (in: high G+C Gram-positive bacteria) TaxID=192944 RepID=UPI00109D8E95|nr:MULTISPECIES: Gfo/Idh/MocA family oxidoreductase [unclassified Rhodococcus (in: high G+C Gram-positive bacteria)]QCB50603.1 dehydrogenase [Rhodococcus sp. PAMC28705]QCB57705.1 dehydrogenase [Rhodococcus sp. PAMC28707]